MLTLLFSLARAAMRPAVLVPIGVLALIAFCLYPGRRGRDLRLPTRYFAHRGLHGDDAPENTPAAFIAARKAGFGVELDLRLTADGETAVFHDAHLERLCGHVGRIETLAAADIGCLPVLGSEQTVPMLKTALEALDGAPVLCDIKGRGIRDRLRVIRAAWPILQRYPGPVMIESFDPFVLIWARRHQPQMLRGLLATPHNSFFLPTSISLLFCRLTRPDFIAYNCGQAPSVLYLLCRLLYKPAAIAWTVTGPDVERKAIRRHYDAFIFEGYDPREPQKEENA